MISSLNYLLNTPYNKLHPISALARFFEWKIIKFLKLNNYKKRIWGNNFLILNNDSVQSMWLMYNYIIDWEEFNLIKSIVKKEDICFDIGANNGYYSVWFSLYGFVHSFEPNEKSFNRLLQNINVNKIENVEANNFGIGGEKGVAKFTLNKDIQNHILIGKTNIDSVEIRIDTVDNYLLENNIERIKFLKIDVEGFEFDVLLGAQNALKNKKIEIIQLEINNSIVNSGHTEIELIDFLKAYGYHLAKFDVENKKLVKIDFEISRENYFAVYDINCLNKELLTISN